jgi:hypothetical protein
MDSTLILYITAFIVVLLIGWIVRLEIRLRNLCIGRNGKSLEDSIVALKNGMEDLYRKNTISDARVSDIRARHHRSIQHVETMRFNPFKGDGSGGNQSFVSALADEDGNGVVLSCLYARNAVNVYAKPLKNFSSEINFSEEEKEVLEKIKNPQ